MPTSSQLQNTSDVAYQSAVLAEYVTNHTGPLSAQVNDYVGKGKL